VNVFDIFLGNLLSAICFWGIALLLGYLVPKIFAPRIKRWLQETIIQLLTIYLEEENKKKGRR